MNLPFYSHDASPIRHEDCTGSNKRNILLIITRQDIPDQIPFVKKVLRAVEIDFDEDIHLYIQEKTTALSVLSDPKVLAHDTLIVFGLKPSQLGIYDSDQFSCQICSFEKITCLLAPPLHEIASAPELKKQLWDRLKEIFHA